MVEFESKEHPGYQAAALAAVQDVRALKQALAEAIGIIKEYDPDDPRDAWRALL